MGLFFKSGKSESKTRSTSYRGAEVRNKSGEKVGFFNVYSSTEYEKPGSPRPQRRNQAKKNKKS